MVIIDTTYLASEAYMSGPMPRKRNMGEEHLGVRRFLENLQLEKYWSIFKAKGYDRESDLVDLDDQDMTAMHIEGEDKQTILRAARTFSPSEEFRLFAWLEQHGLAYYVENFRHIDLCDLEQLKSLELSGQAFDELEMDVPAHRKRLERAVFSLRKRRRTDISVHDALAVGFWGKPVALQYAKNEFLCLQATLLASQDAANGIDIDFMVDSGSDVVTVRPEVLAQLDLELIRTVRSHGVHATREKHLYRCLLRVGTQVVQAEVMSESYDSIGNQVMRHFRHYIDGGYHYWLPGNRPMLPPSTSQEGDPPSQASVSGLGSPVASTSSATPTLPEDRENILPRTPRRQSHLSKSSTSRRGKDKK